NRNANGQHPARRPDDPSVLSSRTKPPGRSRLPKPELATGHAPASSRTASTRPPHPHPAFACRQTREAMLRVHRRHERGAPVEATPAIEHPTRRDYLPIAEYGLIGDGATAALVGRDGTLDWLCVPDFHSDALFRGLLDASRGGAL